MNSMCVLSISTKVGVLSLIAGFLHLIRLISLSLLFRREVAKIS